MFRITGVLILLLVATAAEARPRGVIYAHPDCNVLWPCAGVSASPRGEMIAKQVGFGAARKIYKPRAERADRKTVAVVSVQPRQVIKPSVSLDGVVPILAEKVREIVTTCGSDIWSTVRHTMIAGTRILSQHASGSAVDVHGNPTCIYALLKGWAGGYSTDYGRVNHVHISYGGREHGARFAHGGGRRYARRHVHRHRYAARF